MSDAKIRLSQKEKELVTNADLILTKNAILQKVNQFLADLQTRQQQYLQLFPASLPEKMLGSTPKISKGENYKGLPYSILDYPRFFEKENILAVRTLFWWGNFFSITLHLSGIPKQETEEKLIRAYPALKESGYYCYMNDDPWEHHFDGGNYVPLAEISMVDFEKLARQKAFIKLAQKIPLENWDEVQDILFGYFKQIIETMA